MSAPYNGSCPVYPAMLDTHVVSGFSEPTELRPKSDKLENLMRFRCRIPKNWVIPKRVSCCRSLYIYISCLYSCGQKNVARNLTWYLGTIKNRFVHFLKKNKRYSSEHEDDYYRHMLKKLSAWAFPQIFEGEGKAVYMLYCHLHHLTGRATFTKEQIHSDISTWVGDKNTENASTKKRIDMKHFSSYMDRVFSEWYRGEFTGHLNFREFANDYLRWGTSGGAPKVELFQGGTYRTKWAWALANSTNEDGSLKENYDLWRQAKTDSNQYASVALKEESAKTREVITTPMTSYIRQSYLLYRWGKINVESPISSHSWLPAFEESNPNWYGCVDGEHFDWSVPKQAVIEFLERLGSLDAECRLVADEEIDHIEHLKIKWGDKIWDYNGGLLSGWRITSILGTIISLSASSKIIEDNKLFSTDKGAQGDDVVLYSNMDTCDIEHLVSSYNSFGLFANDKKTASGKVGEFLKKVRCGLGNLGYPALAIRTLVYANPWISNYSYEREEEMAHGWMTLASRLIPHATRPNFHKRIQSFCVSNLRQRWGDKDWESWLCTPQSAGGGGCREWMNPNKRWVTLVRDNTYAQLPKRLKIPAILGAAKRRLVQSNTPHLRVLPMDVAEQIKNYASAYSGSGTDKTTFKHEANITETIFSLMYGSISINTLNSRLTRKIPSYMRLSSRTRLIDFLLSGSKKSTFCTTLIQTPDSISYHSGLQHSVIEQLSMKKNINMTTIKPAMTLYYDQIYSSTSRSFGTW